MTNSIRLIVVFFTSILYLLTCSACPFETLPSSIHETKQYWNRKYNYEGDFEINSVDWDTIYTKELNSPLYKIIDNSPLTRALDIYLNKFEEFLNDTTNFAHGRFTLPYATTVCIDEHSDGSYFFFENWNSFEPRSSTFIGKSAYCHIEYKGHIFFLNKSLLSNIEPTGIEEPVFVNIRELKGSSLYPPEKPSGKGNVIRRLILFIPWRDCVE